MAKTKAKARSGDGGEHDGLVDALAQTTFTIMAVLNKIGADNDLSLTQMRVMAILRDRRPRMAGLADYLGLERSTMSGLIDRAVARGLIGRAPSVEDGRAIEVFLTPAGAELASRSYAEVQRLLAPLTGRLAAADQRRLQELLERLLGTREG